jgi:hypothetical protein
MTDQAGLERSYRRLLAFYPRAFRRENGPEILAVLMAGAPDGRRRPGLAAAADLISSGLRLRLRPSVPGSVRPVRAAARLMYAGAAVTAVSLVISIVSLAVTGRSAVNLRVAGHTQPRSLAVTAGVAIGLGMIAVWLWMARENSLGRRWARVLSLALFVLATPNLVGAFSQRHSGLALMLWAPTWLLGLGVVWLLWRPDSRAFFKPQH